MRGARIREEGPAHYHVISRVIERRLLFKDEEKSRIATYVEDKFKQHRVFFSLKRKTGARPMTGCSIAICTARRLKLDPITVPIVPISTV